MLLIYDKLALKKKCPYKSFSCFLVPPCWYQNTSLWLLILFLLGYFYSYVFCSFPMGPLLIHIYFPLIHKSLATYLKFPVVHEFEWWERNVIFWVSFGVSSWVLCLFSVMTLLAPCQLSLPVPIAETFPPPPGGRIWAQSQALKNVWPRCHRSLGSLHPAHSVHTSFGNWLPVWMSRFKDLTSLVQIVRSPPYIAELSLNHS